MTNDLQHIPAAAIRYLQLFLLLCLASVISVVSPMSKAKQPTVIRSAVSPDFIDGLHSKYLHYIANAMNMQLNITPLSVARRLRALEHGELDLLVGLQKSENNTAGIVFIEPAYQIQASTFFIRKTDAKRLNNYQDLSTLRIAITDQVSYFDKFDNDQQLAKVTVDSLEQKIKLLVNRRVDAFIHNKDSTAATLKSLDLKKQVIAANFQPEEVRKYYFAISEHSAMFAHKDKLVNIVQNAIKQGHFQNIREQHYLDLVKRRVQEASINQPVE